MSDQTQYLLLRIEALEKRNAQLEKQVLTLRISALVNDPNFDKPLSEIETIFEIIKPK